MTERRTWYVRRNGQVKGPFLTAQITRNILLGRVRSEDEISVDNENWQVVARHRELYPDVMDADVIDEKKLQLAKMQADERVVEQRRRKNKMARERRRAKDRRAEESNEMLLHRQHRNEMNAAYEKKMRRPKIPMTSVLIMVITFVGFVYILQPGKTEKEADCSLPPAKGVNWSNCSFIKLDAENQVIESAIMTDATLNQSNLMGAKLAHSNMAYAEITESDLSYADLEDVRLIGANLKKTDLRYANLAHADLSYSDLTQALLAGANINNTKFDHAIWIDGQTCSPGSIGSCRVVSKGQ